MIDLLLQRRAVICDCGRYRYRLEREWGDEPKMTFIMLNPSTADADIDDPTIRRCMRFARRENCGGIVVVNLFALRATDPKELATAAFPFGPDNYSALSEAMPDFRAHNIVCAWGAHSSTAGTDRLVIEMAEERRFPLQCLGKTKDGSPRHPLYVRADQPFEAFP